MMICLQEIIQANLCDIYINDAFSCCHRKQYPFAKITKYSKNNFESINSK